jgi:hypothetical protein
MKNDGVFSSLTAKFFLNLVYIVQNAVNCIGMIQ